MTRGVSESIDACALTYMDRLAIDVQKAKREHASYQALLRELVDEVVELPPHHDTPDSCFVEDNAVVVDEIAVLASMGAPSRRDETERMVPVLGEYREVVRIESPGTLEGGDVFQVGRTVFVGRSTRTNESGGEQLREHLEPLGYSVVVVETPGCLHLTTGGSHIGDGVVLCNPDWIDASRFELSDDVSGVWHVPSDEPWAGNTLLIDGISIVHEGFVRTIEMLRSSGRDVRTLDIEELTKAEAGLTCLSLIFEKTPITLGDGGVRAGRAGSSSAR
ncbi:MAG: dimethylarginine dimethylaminohydrolase family protein [Phycisphaerales bacterium JB043]